MSLFSYFRSIYQLETLDTRFTTSSIIPYRPTPDTQIDSTSAQESRDGPSQGVSFKLDSNGQPRAQPSKWRTPEFYFYYFCFIIIVPYMFWVPYTVSRPSDPNYHKYEHLLSPGWVPGRKIDISDAQYASFRENIPYMGILVLFHPLLRRLYENLRPISTRLHQNLKSNGSAQIYTSTAGANARMNQRGSFDYGFALIFISVLHGFSAVKVILLLYLNFVIATQLPRKYVPASTWVFNIGTLFLNELSGGYKFASIAGLISQASASDPKNGNLMYSWGVWLDSYGGIISRWEILFNITVLRMISFNLDRYWSLDRKAGSLLEKKQLDPAHLSERDRIEISGDANDYSFRNFVAYALYAPLYLTGPIITFNDYIYQLKYPPATIDRTRTIKYGIRFILTFLSMELMLHYDYCVAISKSNPNWADYTPLQLSLLSYFNLHVVWLKLLLPWRFFRLWALIDGIDPPENMVRCISDTPSTMAFWRGWHRSFNRWLLRYMYIPLGGSNTKGRFGVARAARNYLMSFTFVALWHDISLTLLIWGWLVVLFMLPEALACYFFPRKRWLNHLTAYRYLSGVGVVGNLLMMVSANMVGFAVGVDGLKNIISGIFSDFSGIAFFFTVSAVLFVGIQIMFELRESEMRRGVFMKC